MANEIMTVVETGIETRGCELVFKNKKLQSQTRAIEKLMLATKRNMFEIAVRLSVIENENLFEADGFKNVFEYAEQVLGYKKNMVYKMITVADKFIQEVPNSKGYVSVITHDNEDYTVSQLIELNSLDNEDVISLDENEVIAPSMTTKEIREQVKDFKNGKIDKNGERLDTEESEETENENNEISEDEKKKLNKAVDTIFNSLDILYSSNWYSEEEKSVFLDIKDKLASICPYLD